MSPSAQRKPDKPPKPRVSSRLPKAFRQSADLLLSYLHKNFDLPEEELLELRNGTALRLEHAVNMVENAIGVLGLPLGLGLNFVVNDREFLVPMAIEEASIIAAASKAALLIRGSGGFRSVADDPVMIGQVLLTDVPDMAAAVAAIEEHRERIIERANRPIKRMVARGGGTFDLEVRVLEGLDDDPPQLVVHLLIDVQEAMGANAVNYCCEAAGGILSRLTGGRVNLRIVSNYATKRMARSSFRIPFDVLATKDLEGAVVAKRLEEAGRFAHADPYRAATHNKGIFNGVCAAAVALGQDYRAIEAGGHAWAARTGQYGSLTTYRIEDDTLVGEIELPMQVGWIGGAVNTHPGVRLLRRISGVQNSTELAELLAAVGLAQNFAACLALSTVGIQQGHMALHARSVAVSVGVPAADVNVVAKRMIRRGQVSVTKAEEVYDELVRERRAREKKQKQPADGYAPGKVILFGEHATVYGHPGISAAVGQGLKVRVRHDPTGPTVLTPRFRSGPDGLADLDHDRLNRAIQRALDRFDLGQAPISIQIESDLVPGVGLGTSAALSTALTIALKRHKGEDVERHWDERLFREIQRLEEVFHGTPSGMDAATVLTGGVLWFRAGTPQEILPLRLGQSAAGIVGVVEPGASTKGVVDRVRRDREADPERVDGILSEIGSLTTRAGSALGAGDLVEVGSLMTRNHELLRDLGVSTPGLDAAVKLLLQNGALGAKMTGAGDGGAVVALVRPQGLEALLESVGRRFLAILAFSLGA